MRTQLRHLGGLSGGKTHGCVLAMRQASCRGFLASLADSDHSQLLRMWRRLLDVDLTGSYRAFWVGDHRADGDGPDQRGSRELVVLAGRVVVVARSSAW